MCRIQQVVSIKICPSRPQRDSAILHLLKSAQAVEGVIIDIMVYPVRKVISISKSKKIGFDFLLECGHIHWHSTQVENNPKVCKLCPKQWSQFNTSCVLCERTDSKPTSKGKCNRCNTRNGKPLKDFSNFSKNRRFPVNDFLFDEWNEKSAYLLGVIYSDGHVTHPKYKAYQVTIGLSANDRLWLEMLREAFGGNGKINETSTLHPVTKRWFHSIDFRFSSKRIYSYLIDIGAKEQKFQNVPDNVIHHFFRGYWDGDGTFYFSKQANCIQSGIVGDKQFLSESKATLARLIGTSTRMSLEKKTPTGTCWGLTYGKNDTFRIKEFLYKDATLFLERKKLKANQSTQRKAGRPCLINR